MEEIRREIDEEWIDAIEASLNYHPHYVRKELLKNIKDNLYKIRSGDFEKDFEFP